MLYNIGKFDRMIRTFIGMVTMVLGISYMNGTALLIGLFLMITAIVAKCPIYAVLNYSLPKVTNDNN